MLWTQNSHNSCAIQYKYAVFYPQNFSHFYQFPPRPAEEVCSTLSAKSPSWFGVGQRGEFGVKGGDGVSWPNPQFSCGPTWNSWWNPVLWAFIHWYICTRVTVPFLLCLCGNCECEKEKCAQSKFRVKCGKINALSENAAWENATQKCDRIANGAQPCFSCAVFFSCTFFTLTFSATNSSLTFSFFAFSASPV